MMPRCSRREGAEPELAAAVAAGMEPEVLASVRAVCRIRAEALEELLEPRPRGETQPLMAVANQRWLRAAEALLGRHPPGAVLGALRLLARESARPPPPPKTDPDPDLDPDLDPQAPPTIKSLIRECWGAVGGLWGRLPPLAARLHPLRPRLARLRRQLAQRLGGDPKSQRAARLALEAAGLTGARRALARGCKNYGAGGPPKPALGELRRRLHRERQRVGRRQRRLQALARATRTLKGQLRPLQARVRAPQNRGVPKTQGGVGRRRPGWAGPPWRWRGGERLRRRWEHWEHWEHWESPPG
ncbi:uncharacterized protein [Ciconia boyciana]|uniref:uncharacterized protein n=1 Tax=Ciconia boyciana TaxID=52775 RepID=UPI003BA2A612